MKDHFIKSFIYGLGNTSGVVTVLGIVSGIVYLVNNAFFVSRKQSLKHSKSQECTNSVETEPKPEQNVHEFENENAESENRMQMYQRLAEAFHNNEQIEESEDERIDRLLEQDLSFSFCEDEKRYKRLFDHING